jgi:hypothetical protein
LDHEAAPKEDHLGRVEIDPGQRRRQPVVERRNDAGRHTLQQAPFGWGPQLCAQYARCLGAQRLPEVG